MKKNINSALIAFVVLFNIAINVKAVSSKSSQIPEIRLAGVDRYETAKKVSGYGFNGSNENAIIATGENFPDAQCIAPLAKKIKCANTNNKVR